MFRCIIRNIAAPGQQYLGGSSMLRRLLTILPLIALSIGILPGQAFYGSIVGNVNDSSGAALASTTVALTNIATGDHRVVVTATDGSYRFVNLVPGAYRIEIEHPGFKRYARDQIAVSVESQLRADIVMLTPSADAVSESRIQPSNNTAEYGRYTGGVMNIASRSGTNDFHGSVSEYFRNKVLNATNFFANKTGAGRAPFVQNQFGASAGGGVRQDRP